MKKTILITGASRGFGKIWAEAFLKRGDNIIVTSRNIDHLKDFITKYGKAVLPLQLDVTSKADCMAAVNEGKQQFGSIPARISFKLCVVGGAGKPLNTLVSEGFPFFLSNN